MKIESQWQYHPLFSLAYEFDALSQSLILSHPFPLLQNIPMVHLTRQLAVPTILILSSPMLADLSRPKPHLCQSLHHLQVLQCYVFLLQSLHNSLTGTVSMHLITGVLGLFGEPSLAYFLQFGRVVLLPQLRLEDVWQLSSLHIITIIVSVVHKSIPTPFITPLSRPLYLQGSLFCLQRWIRMEGISANKIIMLNYSPVHPARVNPEFIGIATKYGNIKKNRTSLERDRDELLRKLKYRISVDRHLDKTLEENRGKLRTVRSVHRRHQDQMEQKRAKEERHRRDMVALNRTVQMTREQQRQNIRDALSRTQSRNRQSRDHCGQMTTLMESQLRSTEMCRLEEKRLRFKQIKLVERDSQNTVHEFYRERNNGSLNHYQTQIEEERSKYLQFVDDIKKIESSIDHYDTKIDKKKERLVEVLDQIGLYTMESVDTQARCLPLYLRDNLSTSTHSSKPSDILLRGPRSIINDL